MHLNTQLLFRKYALSYITGNIKVLEVGATEMPTDFSIICTDENIIWHTLTVDFDIYKDKEYTKPSDAHIISSDCYKYPIDDETYDIVISSNVMEHVQDILKWVSELKRITKKGGLIITILPLSYPYHEDPIDCWRIYPEGMKYLFEKFDMKLLINTFESLEHDFLPKYFPKIQGRSIFMNKGSRRYNFQILWNKILHYIPFGGVLQIPFEISYDTITIAQKIN
jgi:SAM-dependent methyltransferase